ncbi:MAG TPA: diacylglycerol kinase family protein [Thermoanaerobaculia bacterium]|nr:diacylglycerol kinase family protein [Thermoanaerobaculia bacterium]
MKALFLINERSGKRRHFDVAELIRRTSPFEHRIVACERKEDVDALVDEAESGGFDLLYAVGGDGTVHETAKRLVGRKPALGILPIGSGNGFARHIGLTDAAQSLAACRGGRIETIDTAVAGEHPFLGVMGIGFDAMVADRFASSGTRGLESYVREGLRAFAAYRAEEYEISANGETLRRTAFVIAVANSGQYGNNARIAPLASLQDGLLDVVIVDDTHLLDAAFLLARLFRGTLHRASGVTMLKTAEVVIRRASAGAAHLDGEPVMLGAELRVRVRPASLRLLVPDDAPRL